MIPMRVRHSTHSQAQSIFLQRNHNSTVIWGVGMVYLHMHYVKCWLVSLFTYLLVYIEIMILLFNYYGARLIDQNIPSATMDTIYYIFIFAWFSGCSIFAARTHEMTERKSFYAMYQQERETEEWKRLLEYIPEPIIFTQGGALNFFNKATLELLGLHSKTEEPFEVARGKVLNKLSNLHQKDSSLTLKEVIEQYPDGLAEETLFIYKKDDTKHLLMIKCVKASNSTDHGVIEYIFHDVTALKDLERNKAKDQCFDILLATASHDIRTPLNVMLGVIDVLEDYVKTGSGKEQINVARTCGQRMLHYLQGLNYIRQINTGTLMPTKQVLNPAEVAKKLVKDIGFSAQAKSLNLEIKMDYSVPSTMCSDIEMYSIILQNLLENSIKYTFKGEVKVELKYDEKKKELETTVEDTGVGMTQEQKLSVGMIFRKSKAHRSINPQGLGLGLFLAKTLANQLGGDLNISSEADKGTKAWFTISNQPSEEVVKEIVPIEGYSSPISKGVYLSFCCDCPKVLLVDDEPFNLLVLSAYLSSINVKADRAENGQIALDMINRRAAQSGCCAGYTIIFMDINMPVMDGAETTSRIAELVSQGKVPPCYVIAVTAAIGLEKPGVYASYIEKGFTELCKFMLINLWIQCQNQYRKQSSQRH
eukprot:TRINITY_DN88096_c1_g1_i1.p1 TRINITY_DN88096_c1_g1~~TRINITY_DN88096_c1_g1_i1.p1  ORF type:complete len:647 (+),score=60.03 TRINITY_DN88096_c1_g1_i1:605-2545(+)